MQFYLHEVQAFKKKYEAENRVVNENEIDIFRQKLVFFDNWSRIFDGTDPEKVTVRILPIIKTAILNKKGIFPNDDCYPKVKSKIEELSNIYFIDIKMAKQQASLAMNQTQEFNETDRSRIQFESNNQNPFTIKKTLLFLSLINKA